MIDNKKFLDLYESGNITVTTFCRTFDEYGNKEYIEAFEHNGKFYLRFYLFKRYSVNRKIGKVYVLYHSPLYSSYIKEFDTKEKANNYYLKVVNGKGFRKCVG